MERLNTALLKEHKTIAEDEGAIEEVQPHASVTKVKENVLTEEQLKTRPDLSPDAKQDKEAETPPEKPRRERPIILILAGLGVRAIAAGSFGYRWWQYASTHQETDNVTIYGHIHQVSNRVNGTAADVLVRDNKLVIPDQLK
ncbi:MAG: hypothetical protein KME08_00200 [Aphanothece sp. CMT-3BRIN-NPC111]|jgi:membrane fusion protein (multidrug efflux system)|nr:hypothetical protein [Aphanothece sp. CMT-3BRIN-NPC111]